MKIKYLILSFLFCIQLAHTSKLIRNLTNENGATDATSLSIWHNPAAIAFINSTELGLGYRFNNFSSKVINHLFNSDLAAQITKSTSLGLGFSSLNNSLFSDNSIAFGIASQASNNISIGLSVFKRLKSNNDFLFSLGLINRPAEWISWSGLYQETHNGYFSSPNIILGLGLRPIGDILTIGLDNKFLSSSNKWKDGFHYQPNISLQTEFNGIGLKTAIELPYKAYKNPIISLGLTFNFNHLGFGLVGNSNINKNYLLGTNVRFSNKKYPSIVKDKNQWLSLDIDAKGYRANSSKNILQKTITDDIPQPLEIINSLEKLALDKSIDGIFLRIRGFNIAQAQASEWRNALLKLKQNNKKIIIHLQSSSEIDYFIASLADRILMDPNATIDFTGFSTQIINIAKPLELIGIKAHATVSGKYKNAPNFFTNDSPTKEEISVKTNILKYFYEDVIEKVSSARNIDKKIIKSLFDKGEITAKEAYDAKLVDKLIFNEDSKNYIEENFASNISFFDSYEQSVVKTTSWRKKQTFAIIPLYGTIVAGRVTHKIFSLLGNNQTGSEDFIDSLKEAIKNPTIEGIIIHINSPGGTFDGSHEIYRAIKNTSNIKPIVISMSDVAASGAYQAALGSKYIFASNNTLTGSVGVYSLSFEASKLAKLLGLNHQEISMVKNTKHNLLTSMDKNQKANRQHIVDWHYDTFVSLMATNMNIEKKQAFDFAQGRVWLGAEALKNGIIHEIGGLNDAIAKLKELTFFAKNDYDLVFINPNNKGLSLMNIDFFGNSINNITESLYKEIENLSKVQAKLNF